VVEVAGQTADHRLVAGVGHAEAPAREATEVLVGRHDDHRLAHARGLHGRGHRRRRAAVHDDILRLVGRRPCCGPGNRGHDEQRCRKLGVAVHGKSGRPKHVSRGRQFFRTVAM
jgi:hypothetical protein